MRILHLIQRYGSLPGGAEVYLQAVSERLVRDGHQVTVATTNVVEIRGFWEKPHAVVSDRETAHRGVRIIRFPIRQPPFPHKSYHAIRRTMAELSRRGWGSVALLQYLSRCALSAPQLHRWLAEQRGQFDLIAAMGIGFDSLYAPALAHAHRERIPFLFYPLLHWGQASPDSPQEGLIAGGRPSLKDYYTMRHQVALLRDSAAVFAQTPLEVEFLKTLGIDGRRIVLAGVGVEPTENLGGDVGRFRALIGVDAPIVLALGTQAVDKGTLHLIEAMRNIWACGGDAHLALVGSAMPEVEQAVKALPGSVRRRVHLLGRVDDQVKRDALATCALLALPSRTDSFGTVLLEAWLNEKPVIGARAGGLPAVIAEERDGLLIPFGDVPALTASVQRLLADEQLRVGFGRAGRDKVLSRYTWDVVYPRIRDIYERLYQTYRRSGA